jgi:hypothetical protein
MHTIRISHAAHMEPAAICYSIGLHLVERPGELRLYDGERVEVFADWAQIWRRLCERGHVTPIVC